MKIFENNSRELFSAKIRLEILRIIDIYNRYIYIILFFLRILSIDKKVIEVLIIFKVYIVVVADILAIVIWNSRNLIVFYEEDNFYDNSNLASEIEL